MNSFLTSSDAAKRLGVTASIVARYCRLGRLTATKVGRDWLITQRDLERFIALPRERGNPSFKKR